MGEHSYTRVVPDAPEVELEAAGRRAQLGEIAVHPDGHATQEGLFFDQDYVLAGVSRFNRRGYPAYSSSHYQDIG
jgi:ribosomal protein S18 acetylase RimI-like enzyme